MYVSFSPAHTYNMSTLQTKFSDTHIHVFLYKYERNLINLTEPTNLALMHEKYIWLVNYFIYFKSGNARCVEYRIDQYRDSMHKKRINTIYYALLIVFICNIPMQYLDKTNL